MPILYGSERSEKGKIWVITVIIVLLAFLPMEVYAQELQSPVIEKQDRYFYEDAKRGWYWYEVISTTDPTQIVKAGNGVAFCAGCHSPGRDFIRISPSNFNFQ